MSSIFKYFGQGKQQTRDTILDPITARNNTLATALEQETFTDLHDDAQEARKATHTGYDITVAVAESVTVGALSSTLCTKEGSSIYFKGGIVAYSISSKKDILGIDTKYAEQNNFANPFTTLEMARSVAKMFKSRFGIATTGYSLPLTREANPERGECALDIKNPYAYICLYDSVADNNIIHRVDYEYSEHESKIIQRATVQAKVALEGKKMFVLHLTKLYGSDVSKLIE